MPKTIMLEWPSAKFIVTEEGYELIKQMIREHQVCPGCRERIDQTEHLLVGKKCLACVLNASPSLTFIGVQRESDDGVKIYAFINRDGITLTSTENSSELPQEDVAFSIETAGFTIPTKYKPFKSDEEVVLSRDAWTVYGKLSQSVVVLHYKDSSNSSKGREVDFLAYKGAQTDIFNRRTTEHQNLLEKARTLAGRLKRSAEESSLFEIISRLESAVYNELLTLLEMEPAQEQPASLELFTQQPLQLETAREKRNKQEEK